MSKFYKILLIIIILFSFLGTAFAENETVTNNSNNRNN